MQQVTQQLWAKQDRHSGDRKRLFAAVHDAMGGKTVFYPGSFVDLAPSFIFESVTYVDMDKRAAGFFADDIGIRQIIASEGGAPTSGIEFIPGDYRKEIGVPESSCDLLVSLYAGFVSEFCTQYLRIGGVLLAAPSHGDVAMASIDSRLELCGVVRSRSGQYRVSTDALDSYLVPRKPIEITAAMLHERGRGIAYTKSPFAYLFRRIA